jgi:hypothetical protein
MTNNCVKDQLNRKQTFCVARYIDMLQDVIPLGDTKTARHGKLIEIFLCFIISTGRSQWPCGLWRGSTVARLLGSRVRIPPGEWMSVCCECCVLSGRGLCDGLITHLEESYRVWCVMCDREAS